jgi:hypothetical protein
MKKSNENDFDAMNPDDFEPELQRQPIKPVPAEWRAEILARAGAAVTPQAPQSTRPSFRWRELFWPLPQAWAGLAVIWLVILTVNYSTADKSGQLTQKEPPPSPELRMALKEQALMMAKLIEPFEQPAAEPPKPSNPRPRSESRQIGTA